MDLPYLSRKRSFVLHCQVLCIIAAITLASALLPSIAYAQQSADTEDSFRRIIFVPGVDFDKKIDPDEGPYNACDRAWRDPKKGTFYTIAQYLKNQTLYVGFSRYVYNDTDFLAFSYSTKWTPLGRPRPVDQDSSPVIDKTITTVTNCDELNNYVGSETREHVILSAYKFQAQIKLWRSQCSFCRFDVICHSLGGAVVTYWTSQIASNEDLAYIHSVTTIDSPINGITPFGIGLNPIEVRGSATRTGIKILKQLVDSAGDAGLGLQGDVPKNADFFGVNFLDNLRKDPPKADFTCIGNIYDTLILSSEATRSSCNEVYEGEYSAPIDWTALPSQLQKNITNAHNEPLQNSNVKAAIDLTLVVNGTKWRQSISLRTSSIADRDSRIAAISTFPIVAPSAETSMQIALRNTGVQPWDPEHDFFILVGDTLFERMVVTPLVSPVPASKAASLTLTFNAPKDPGVYTSDWQMSYDSHPYGDKVSFNVVVLSDEQRNPGGLIQAFAQRLWDGTVDEARQLTEQAKREASALIRREIERQIQRLLCGVPPAALAAAGVVVIRRKRRQKRGGHDNKY